MMIFLIVLHAISSFDFSNRAMAKENDLVLSRHRFADNSRIKKLGYLDIALKYNNNNNNNMS